MLFAIGKQTICFHQSCVFRSNNSHKVLRHRDEVLLHKYHLLLQDLWLAHSIYRFRQLKGKSAFQFSSHKLLLGFRAAFHGYLKEDMNRGQERVVLSVLKLSNQTKSGLCNLFRFHRQAVSQVHSLSLSEKKILRLEYFLLKWFR